MNTSTQTSATAPWNQVPPVALQQQQQQVPPVAPQQQQQQQPQVKLTEVPVNSENVALNLMVGFLDVAQKRGAFSFDESAKILECIQKFAPNKA